MFPLLPRANEGPPRKPTGGLVRPTNYMSFSFRCRQGVPQLAKASLGPSMSCPRHRPHSALLVYLEIDLDPLLRSPRIVQRFLCLCTTDKALARSGSDGAVRLYSGSPSPSASCPASRPPAPLSEMKEQVPLGIRQRLFRLLKSSRPTLRFVHRPHAGNNFPSACLLPRIQVDARGG